MTKKEKISLALLCAALVLATLFIFSNSLKSREESGADSSFILSLVEPVFDAVFGEGHGINVHFLVRKAGHLTEFCILGVIVLNLARFLQKRYAPRLFGYCLFYVLCVAVSDEFIQLYSGRGSAVSDVIIDFCGALIGFGITFVFCIIKNRRRKNENTRLERKS